MEFPPRVPLRVCMLATCPFPANHGTPGSIREMAEALVTIGHEVHIVTYHYGEDIPLKGPRLHRIAPLTRESQVVVGPTIRRPLYDAQMVFKAIEVVRKHRADVIHAHGYEAALVASACRVVTGHPVVYSAHHTMADELPTYGFIKPQWLARGMARALDYVVPRLANRCLPHSANALRVLRAQGLAARTHDVVNFGIDVESLERGDGDAVRRQYALGSAPILVYTGVLDHFQRLDILIEALANLRRDFKDITLLLVTTVPQPQHVGRIRAHAARLGIAEHVVITEPQPLDRLRDFLSAADITVVPRPAAFGFPIKLLNYMAARRPSVLFESSSSVGIVNRENALLTAPDTPGALAQSIAELLNDGTLREKIADGGYRFVRANHDRQAIARQISQCYEQVLPAMRRSECHAFSS